MIKEFAVISRKNKKIIKKYPSPGAEGAEVIYALRDTDKLANKILNAISEKGQTVRKYYQRRLPSDTSKDYYYIIRNTPNAETVIVEYGFLDNTNDAQKLKSNYKEYAEAVVEAVLDYKNIPYDKSGYYTVKKGDSLYTIAKKFDTTVEKLKSTNNLTSNTLQIGQVLKIPGTSKTLPTTHTVSSGETLYKIASTYGTTVNELKKLNNLISDNLYPGQTLKLPGTTEENIGNTYTVKKGDTLYQIASKYNISVDELKTLNNLTSNTLSVGQTLKIRNNTSYKITEDYDFYTIKNGDTLFKIANEFNTTADEIKKLNNLTSNALYVGQIIKIPQTTSTTYIVKKGDTLWSIAKDNNTTVDDIKELNNLINNSLTIGQQLLLKQM